MYYHETGVDTAVSLDFELGGNVDKLIQQKGSLTDKDSDVINSYYEGIISDTNRSYLQSMADVK